MNVTVVEYFRQFSFNQTTTIVTQRMTTRYRIYKLKENACQTQENAHDYASRDWLRIRI